MTKVLIVDDDLVARILARHVVSSSGWQPIEASNGAEALELFKQENIDIILCDQEMPGLNGLEVLQEIRRSSDVPFILLTGHVEEDELDLDNYDISSYITKPVSSSQLKQSINEALSLKSL